MKNFILTINKYKKWIVLGLSILMFVLFFFPIMPTEKDGEVVYCLPWFIGQIISLRTFDNLAEGTVFHSLYTNNAFYALFSSLSFVLWVIFTVITLIKLFCNKKFVFTVSIALFFLCDLIKSLSTSFIDNNFKYYFNMWYTFPITLILLILDIVYLCLERKYLKENKQEQESEEVVKTF